MIGPAKEIGSGALVLSYIPSFVQAILFKHDMSPGPSTGRLRSNQKAGTLFRNHCNRLPKPVIAPIRSNDHFPQAGIVVGIVQIIATAHQPAGVTYTRGLNSSKVNCQASIRTPGIASRHLSTLFRTRDTVWNSDGTLRANAPNMLVRCQ